MLGLWWFQQQHLYARLRKDLNSAEHILWGQLQCSVMVASSNHNIHLNCLKAYECTSEILPCQFHVWFVNLVAVRRLIWIDDCWKQEIQGRNLKSRKVFSILAFERSKHERQAAEITSCIASPMALRFTAWRNTATIDVKHRRARNWPIPSLRWVRVSPQRKTWISNFSLPISGD